MTKKHYIYNKVAATLFAAATLTSCGDFLDTLPMNEIVKDNFYTKKLDATQLLDGCYSSFANYDNVGRMAIWGEARSENVITKGGNKGLLNAVRELNGENMRTTNELTKWLPIYRTINYCNTFIKNAPTVQQLDPNYSLQELKSNIAEATALRDLCYFYLLRAYRAVPITFTPSDTDEQDYEIQPDSLMPGINKLINDLKTVENDAVKRYYDITRLTNAEIYNNAEIKKNSARITRSAIHAILADMNLWCGNYDEAIRYCDLVIENKKESFKERVAYRSINEFPDMMLINEIPLIREKILNTNQDGNAYKEIFVWGHSVESIFEISYNSGGITNSFVDDFYKSGYEVSTIFTSSIMKGENAYFTIDDCRAYENIVADDNKTPSINKYVGGELSKFEVSTLNANSARPKPSGSINRPNWIIYRLTDIMLMKAEALIEKGGDDNLKEAFKLIDAVYQRAHSLNRSLNIALYINDGDPKNQEKMRDLCMEERQRELMFEGKRWFDLVRRSVREQNTDYLSDKASDKQKINQDAISSKFKEFDFIFYPYNKEELKLNHFLRQNKAYGNTEDFVQ